ncbi:MAG: fasciclin domain-containing protein, partial [Candidatus Thalassarchaeaceae archaeon]
MTRRLRAVIISLMVIALPATQVSADDETNSSPEVTIGFGNVTNDTLSFTMDTSVDVYGYQVVMSWETGAVYCAINGFGGLSEDYNLWASVLYAGCLTTGYYYGAQGIYHIPAGSNGTLTSIFYQSNSPEVCMGSASYAVLDANDELEWRNATVDPNDCLTYTKYETWDDLWYVLDEDGNDEGDNETDSWSPVFISFIADSSEINDIWFEIYDCSGNLYLQAGAPYEGYTELPNDFIVIIVDASGDGWNEGSNIYIDGYGNFSVENGYYNTISNCDGNDIDDSLYPFNEDLSVLENLEIFDDFSILMEALNITGLVDDLSPSNTPQMGWTIFAPTNDAFASIGLDLDELDTSEEVEILTEILLYHVTFAGPYALDSSTAYNSSSGEYEPHCQPYTIDGMPMLNGEYADPFDYSSWTENVTISNDCQGNLTVNQANIIDADNRVYGYEYNGVDGFPFNNELPHGWAIAEDNGMIQVIDQILIPSSLNLSQLPTSSPRFDPQNDVPTVLQNDGSFDILISALNITGLLDLTREGNSPNMGFTMIAPTDEAFQAIGFDLDDVDTQEEIDILTEILLHHTTIHPEGYTSAVVWFSDEFCTGVDYELNVGNGEYAEPGNASSWTETLTVSDDCQGNRTIGGANVTSFQGVSNGVIAVIDSVLIPDSLASPPQSNQPRFNPRFDIPSNLADDGEFENLVDALAMTMLMDDLSLENSPEPGMTI